MPSEEAVEKFGSNHVCVSVDAKDGMVRTRGWLSETAIRATGLLNQMASERNVRHFIYTDTTRDGTLSHPNFETVQEVVREIEYPIMVAGGIATVEDVVRLRDIGARAAITGMAIYTGSLDLADAIRAVDDD